MVLADMSEALTPAPEQAVYPRVLPAGDRFVLIELDARMTLPLNLRAIQLADRLIEERVPGIIETLPMFVSVLVHYDSLVLEPQKLIGVITQIWQTLSRAGDVTVPSRLIELPVYYLDPWTKDCVEHYSRTIKPIGDDPTFVAQTNGLSGSQELVQRHSSTQHWIGGVGFYPGLPDMMPLDPRAALSVPKYNPPRLRTTPGAIGVGGGFTSVYPMDTPGGYHLIGRTPVPIFSFDQRFAPFRTRPTLFQPGDRVKFRPIGREEWDAITAWVAEGTYDYLVWDFELFSLSRYEQWVAGLDQRHG
jgi:urea carboxylase